MQDKTTTQIECPKCHRKVFFPAVSVKAKCPNCGEIVRKEDGVKA